MTREPHASYVVEYLAEQCRLARDAEERLSYALEELRSSHVSDDEIRAIERRVREHLCDTARFELVASSE
jgi:hypothetical protein